MSPSNVRPSTPATSTRTAIINIAVNEFGKRGYYGASLQAIADGVGITKAGVLYHFGSKENLLTAALCEGYDDTSMEILRALTHVNAPSISRMFRSIIDLNAERPHHVQMFSTLNAEAVDPDHPAHEYFMNREQLGFSVMRDISWNAPEGVDTDRLLIAGFSMMDGLQLRWLHTPGSDLRQMWDTYEPQLLPSPMWDGYR